MTESAGIHHITAITGDVQKNVDFYAGVLGLRFVKRTVNQDDPTAYHLYFADKSGQPGTVLTFFGWPDSPKGNPGLGQATHTAFQVPVGALDYWRERLGEHKVKVLSAPRFGEEALAFRDPDGLQVELVESRDADRAFAWEDGPVPPEQALCGFHSTTLTLDTREGTRHVLEDVLKWRFVDEEGDEDTRQRYAAPDSKGPGLFVDLLGAPQSQYGIVGRGSVHHVAYRAKDDAAQKAMRERVSELGLQATHVIDRLYFKSVYFREPGGVLFELATDEPGMTADEPLETLGEELVLQPWLEDRREEIEAALPPIRTPPEPQRVIA